jgi:putative ABC transport system permease protein
MDPSLPVGRVRIMEDVVAASAAGPRMTAFLMFIFAALATLLAAVGLYGVLAYAVSRRVREIGVRAALGARPRDILTMIAREGGALALAGILLGGAAALAGGRLVASLLYEIQPADPVSLLSAGLLLFAVALLASLVPAWRAARVTPADSLREE